MRYGVPVHADVHVDVRSFHEYRGQRITDRVWELIEKSLLHLAEGCDSTDGLTGKV